jgi:lipopolysaccharide/colanic/teichoic acid biosynthesis glycosyltransferase
VDFLTWKTLKRGRRLDSSKSGMLASKRKHALSDLRPEILAVDSFRRMLCLERKRAERSRNLFLLMLVDARKLSGIDNREGFFEKLTLALCSATRETDICGWYEDSVLGVIFTEIRGTDGSSLLGMKHAKVMTALRNRRDSELVDQIDISFHLFPEDGGQQGRRGGVDPTLYPDLFEEEDSRGFPHSVKRMMDVVGSAAALVVLSPLWVVISLATKLTSKGPILFRQERVGQYGIPFTLLKFRSMEDQNDPRIHLEYVKRFISREVDPEEAGKNRKAIYKIQDDSRVTRFGRFLRRSSLDELPQLVNVLKGEMSLVGPRPPISYEVANYDIWHRRRVFEVKPGITGLWQVQGRSRTTFDDMVRLDLRYASSWSLWLDIKILLQTPRAVLSGEGAR